MDKDKCSDIVSKPYRYLNQTILRAANVFSRSCKAFKRVDFCLFSHRMCSDSANMPCASHSMVSAPGWRCISSLVTLLHLETPPRTSQMCSTRHGAYPVVTRLWGSKVLHSKLYNNLDLPRTSQRPSQADRSSRGHHRGRERPGEKVRTPNKGCFSHFLENY